MGASSDRETVVVAVDGSAASAAAARWAAAEAVRRHARLHAVHVVEHDPRLGLDLARQSIPGRVCRWILTEGIDVDLAVSVVTGDVAGQLARETADASLLVLGTPEGIQHRALPSELATRCLCPVATIGEHGDVTFVDRSTELLSTEGPSHART